MELTIFVMNEQINVPHLYSSKVGTGWREGTCRTPYGNNKKKTRKLFQWTGKANYPIELLTFIWDYDNRTVNLSMPGYVQAAATAQISAHNAQLPTRCTVQDQSTTIWNKSITHR